MSALLDCVQQLLMRRALEAWPEMPRASEDHPHAPIAEWHSRLDVLEARLAARQLRRLDAEAATTEDKVPHGMDDHA